jgi:hypothetical protein
LDPNSAKRTNAFGSFLEKNKHTFRSETEIVLFFINSGKNAIRGEPTLCWTQIPRSGLTLLVLFWKRTEPTSPGGIVLLSIPIRTQSEESQRYVGPEFCEADQRFWFFSGKEQNPHPQKELPRLMYPKVVVAEE